MQYFLKKSSFSAQNTFSGQLFSLFPIRLPKDWSIKAIQLHSGTNNESQEKFEKS